MMQNFKYCFFTSIISAVSAAAVLWWWWWWWWRWIVYAVWLTDEKRSLMSSLDHCQRFSPSRISDTLRVGFEPAQNLCSGFDKWSCAVVITTTPQRHKNYLIFENDHFCIKNVTVKMLCYIKNVINCYSSFNKYISFK